MYCFCFGIVVCFSKEIGKSNFWLLQLLPFLQTKAERVVAYRKQLEMEEKMNEDEVSIRKTRDEHLKTYKADLEKRRTLGVRRIGRRTGIRPKEYIENKDPKVAIIVKSDVDGSLEAIMDVVGTYYSNLCRLDIVHYGVGNVLESDINLAEPFKGGFTVCLCGIYVRCCEWNST